LKDVRLKDHLKMFAGRGRNLRRSPKLIAEILDRPQRRPDEGLQRFADEIRREFALISSPSAWNTL